MKTKKGFTLIELLVVIAIIALLMSILMPALAQVRKQAKDMACSMALKQWGSLFSMYLTDHDNNFMVGKEAKWMLALRPYYAGILRTKEVPREFKIRFCSMAMNFEFNTKSALRENSKQPFAAWQLFPTAGGDEEYLKYYWDGSYGSNSWFYGGTGGSSFNDYWKNANVKKTDQIPVLLDSARFGGFPKEADPEGAVSGDITSCEKAGYYMRQFCIDRHVGTVNCLFMDFSVRPVGLKELWTLKWHRSFNTSNIKTLGGNDGQPAVWEIWMRKFKDY